MTDRPINLKAHEVVAVLQGRKTQHRVALKPQPDTTSDPSGAGRWGIRNRYDYFIPAEAIRPFDVGDRLWCREAHQFRGADYGDSDGDIEWFRCYGADASDNWDPMFPRGWEPSDTDCARLLTETDEQEEDGVKGYVTRRKPPASMPRWASRLTLLVTGVRVERLQAISEEDAIAEGILVGEPLPEIPDSEGDIYHDGVTDPIDGWTRAPVEAFANLWSATHGPDAWARNDWVAAITFTTIRANIDAPEAQEQPAA